MDTIVHHQCPSSAHALSPLEISSRKLRRMRNTCVRHFPELEQLAAWHCSTVMNMAYRHIHTALRFALSGDEQGLGSRGAEPCFPAPPPAPALRFPALPPPWAALMLPSAGPRGAHTARSDRPCGTTTDGPEPAPTRRSSVASAHPKPGYQRGQARACPTVIFMPFTLDPSSSLRRGSHSCQMTIYIHPMEIKNSR